VSTIKTNRDLYLAVTQLVKQEEKNKRSLESYLLALLSLGQQYQHRETLAPDEFFGMLTRAFHETALPFNEVWRKQDYDRNFTGFLAWQNRIIYQIVDLRAMKEAGTLNDTMRYFGIDAPRGSRWYNFEPGSFLVVWRVRLEVGKRVMIQDETTCLAQLPYWAKEEKLKAQTLET
jgi:hypothetical protein